MTSTRFRLARRARGSLIGLAVVAAITARGVAAYGSSKPKTSASSAKSSPTTFTSHAFATGVPITIKTPSGPYRSTSSMT